MRALLRRICEVLVWPMTEAERQWHMHHDGRG